MHHDATVDPTARKKNPDIVRFYNSTKGAVDALDKMAHTFTTKRVTRRWPMSMWFNTLDLSTVAARIIWSKKFPNDHLAARDTRQQFIAKSRAAVQGPAAKETGHQNPVQDLEADHAAVR